MEIKSIENGLSFEVKHNDKLMAFNVPLGTPFADVYSSIIEFTITIGKMQEAAIKADAEAKAAEEGKKEPEEVVAELSESNR